MAKGKKRERSGFSRRLGRKKKKTLADKPYHSKIEELVSQLTLLTLPPPPPPPRTLFALATIVRAPLHLNAYFAGTVQKEETIRLRDQAALPVVYIAEHCRPRRACKGTSTAAGVVSKSLKERTWQQVWPCVVWWAGCWDDLDILVE